MSSISVQSFSTIVSNAVTSVQGAAQKLLDLTVGSVIRAILESASGIALWLQGMVLQVASLTRFATSNGPDADSWAADFNFPRLPAKPSTSPDVQFSRFTPTAQALIPAATQNGTTSTGTPIWVGGTIAQTQDTTQQFQVIPDTTQPAYSASLNAYVVPAGVASVMTTVQATVAGSGGNVGAGLISALGNSIPGIDTVTNTEGLTNGTDQEQDTAFKARFVSYINSLPEGTLAAINSAIEDIQQDIFYDITPNQDYDGTPDNGFFYVVVDDGTGAPSSNFLSTVYNTVDAVRPFTSRFAVFPPILLAANINMSLTIADGFNLADLDSAVSQALQKYLGTLEIGESLPYTRLAQIAYDTSPGITNVTGVTLNGGASDLVADGKSVIRGGALAVQ